MPSWDIHNYINPGSVGLLIFCIVSGAMGKWVWGWVYTAMRDERDFWRERALGIRDTAKGIVDELKTNAHD